MMRSGGAVALAAALLAVPAAGQITNDPFPEPIPESEGAITVGVSAFARLPDVAGAPARPMVLIDEPGSGRLFVNDMWGFLHAITYEGAVSTYLDMRDPRWGVAVRRPAELAPIMELGIQSFAFHPHFAVPGTAGFGKLYTWSDLADRSRPADFVSGITDPSHHLVLHEWSAADPFAAVYDGGPPRELLRIEQPFDNHNGGRIAFNTTARPGDADFGNLYVGVGDGGAAGDELDIAQNLGGILGKILRIQPLGSNSANGRYGIPADNPYAADGIARTLGEIYASGVRNPQGYDWDRLTGDLFLADIGQSVVEKLTRVPKGADLGWNTWEGSYRYASQTRVDMANPRAEPWITYPVAEFDHQDPLLQRLAAATGVVVYREPRIPQLTDRILWGDLTSGEVFHVAADGLTEGGQAPLARVLFRNGGGTATLLDLIRAENAAQGREPAQRADLHFGRGPAGRVFVLNKWDGVVREVEP